MSVKKPLFWHQGLFLQPQHFQYIDLYYQSLHAPVADYGHPHFWGVTGMEIDASALAERTFALVKGEFIFQDGTVAGFPQNCIIQPRSFDDAWVDPERPFTVYLGIHKFVELSQNVTIVTHQEETSRVTTRFVTTETPEEVADMHGGGPSAQVKKMDYLLKIFWETELEELHHYNLIPLARLERDGDDIALSRRFVPPVITVSASDELQKMIKDVRDQAAARCRQLEEYKSPREVQATEIESNYVIYLLALRSLNRCVPALIHMAETKDIHPWVYYGVLRQLIGELSTFSDQVGATGELYDGTRALPPYDHRDLWECFSAAHKLISGLLNRIMIGPEHIIRLKREGDYFTSDIPATAFDSHNIYYLVIRTNIEPDAVPECMRTIAKLSSTEHIGTLISRALHGIRLEQSQVPPPGLPRRPNSFYFRIDHTGSQWFDVQHAQNIALYWDTAPEDLTAEIVILRG